MEKPTKSKKIKFISFNRKSDSDLIHPVPAVKELPDWYMSAKRFAPENGEPTFKSCISFMDAMGLGYYFLLPCDISISIIEDKVNIEMNENFVEGIQVRQAMPGFHHPVECYPEHLAFIPQWGVNLPQGYSALYTTPMNNFQLPFVCTSGVIENDKLSSPGAVPIFIKMGFQGILKKGTPFLQVIPFKRDEWESEIAMLSYNDAMGKHTEVGKKFRSVKAGYYRDNYWVKKIFK